MFSKDCQTEMGLVRNNGIFTVMLQQYHADIAHLASDGRHLRYNAVNKS